MALGEVVGALAGVRPAQRRGLHGEALAEMSSTPPFLPSGKSLHAATATVRRATPLIHGQVPLWVPLEHHKGAQPVTTGPIGARWRTPRQCGRPLLPPVMVMDRVRPAALRPGGTDNPGVGSSILPLSTISLVATQGSECRSSRDSRPSRIPVSRAMDGDRL